MKGAVLVLFAAGVGLVFPPACGSGGVVGGECIQGLCGRNGGTLDGGIDIDGAIPDGSADAGQGDGSGGGEPDATDDGSSGDGSSGDGSSGDGSMCLPPHDEPGHCGDCDTQCAPPDDICSPDGMGGFECVPMCEPPLTECANQCVDTNIDPMHCGECFNECPSGICQAGMCVGANVGHVVLMCMNYDVISQNAAQTGLLGNAVFLPVTNPVRILAYTEYAPAAERGRVNQVISWAGAARGRSHAITVAPQVADVTAELNIMDFDVLLVYDQPDAAAGVLQTVGSTWQSNLVVDSFARAGGTVIVLSGGAGEMGELMTSSGLLTVNAELDATGTEIYNRAPADAIGINVISPFLGAPDTCAFDTPVAPGADTFFVFSNAAAPAAGEPVVVHRVFAPP